MKEGARLRGGDNMEIIMNKGLFNKCLLDDRLLICRFELKLY